MRLRFRGARADGRPGDEVREVLRHDGIEEFGGGGQAELADFQQKGAREAQALGDVVGAVQVGIGHEALPPDGGAGLLKIDAHDEEHDVLHLAAQLGELERVGQAADGIMNGAGPDDGEKARLLPANDFRDLGTARRHGLRHFRRHRQVFFQFIRGEEGLHRTNPDIIQGNVHNRAFA